MRLDVVGFEGHKVKVHQCVLGQLQCLVEQLHISYNVMFLTSTVLWVRKMTTPQINSYLKVRIVIEFGDKFLEIVLEIEMLPRLTYTGPVRTRQLLRATYTHRVSTIS